MPRWALIVLGILPFLVVAGGVISARVIPFWPFRLIEAGYEAGSRGSSCIPDAAAAVSAAPSFQAQVNGALDPWNLAVFADAPACRKFDVFNLLGRAQCVVRAPATIVYRNAQMGERRFRIETIGEHRVRASRHGLSCHQLS